ncbi:MAG: cobalamin-binding protein [Acidobacteriota bacterium]
MNFPRRIVCLTAETVETLYLLDEQDRIVGVSGFCTRPPEVRSKPRISTFKDASIDAIRALNPDLVLAFSDVQADVARQLILSGFSVLSFNQRSVAEIFDMMALLARIVDRQSEGALLIAQLRRGLDEIAASAHRLPHRPRVFFEEWNEPLISGIRWVDELITIAGGDVIFPEKSACPKAMDRVVDPAQVIERDPEVIFVSWCGKKANIPAMIARPGWSNINAVRNGHVYEIPSSSILQPGPAALTDGVTALHQHLCRAAGVEPLPSAAPHGIPQALLL